jgi:hypothetical protein
MLGRILTTSRTLICILTILFSVVLSSSSHLRAADGVDVVPADAAFFISQPRIGQQWSALMASNFMKKIQQLQEQFGGQEAIENQVAGAIGDPSATDEFKQFWEDPENKELLALLWDMIDDEVFIYGGPDYIELGELMKKIDAAQREMMLENISADFDAEPVQPDFSKIFPIEQVEQVNAPATVIGFKISNVERANAQLARAQKLLEDAFAEIPELAGRLGNIKIGEHQLLTMTLDGEQIPWEDVEQQLEADESIEDKEYFRKLIAIVKKKTVTVTVGVIGEFLVVSLGNSNDHLRNFGTDPLIEKADLAPLKKMRDKPLTSVYYFSDEFLNSGRTPKYMMAAMKDYGQFFVKAAEQENGELDPELKKQINADISEFVDDLAKYVPDPGAMLHFSYMIDNGYESYNYNHASQLVFDGSKELTILEHLGGDPIAFSVGRSTFSIEDYEVAKKWMGKLSGYMDRSVAMAAESGDEEQTIIVQHYEDFKREFGPYAGKLDKIITDQLIPALKDNQSGFVLDNKLHSKQWFEGAPPAEEPLPMLQPAYVWGVSDVTMLRAGIINLYKLGDELVASAKKLSTENELPDDIPFEQIPRPTRENVRGGAIFYYDIPAPIESNETLAASLGLSTDAAALTITKEHATRLMNRQTLTVDCLAAEHKGPAAAATFIDFARIIDTAEPWVEYGIKNGEELGRLAPGPGDFDFGEEPEFEDVAPQLPDEDFDGGDLEGDLFDENSINLPQTRPMFEEFVLPNQELGRPAEAVPAVVAAPADPAQVEFAPVEPKKSGDFGNELASDLFTEDTIGTNTTNLASPAMPEAKTVVAEPSRAPDEGFTEDAFSDDLFTEETIALPAATPMYDDFSSESDVTVDLDASETSEAASTTAAALHSVGQAIGNSVSAAFQSEPAEPEFEAYKPPAPSGDFAESSLEGEFFDENTSGKTAEEIRFQPFEVEVRGVPVAPKDGEEPLGDDLDNDLFDESSQHRRRVTHFVAQLDEDPFGAEPAADPFGEPTDDPFGEEVAPEEDPFREFSPEARQEQIEANLKISKTVFQMLKVLGAYSSVTYMEGDVTVTRTRWEFNDLPAAALTE